MATTVSFNLNKNKGFVGTTIFKFSSIIFPELSSRKIVWNFGDGLFSSEPEAEHIYKTPGEYNVSLTVYSPNEEPIRITKKITVDLILNESIYFDFVPPPAYAGHFNKYPFRLKITSSNTADHYIDLGAQFSRSYPPDFQETKWSFLKPHWKFYDVYGKEVKSIKTTDTVIRCNTNGELDPNGSLIVGVTGYADFYFVDDIYNFDLVVENKPYTTIVATLQTSAVDISNFNSFNNQLPSFANSLAVATHPYIVLYRQPETLKITENGIRVHSNPRWSTASTPLLVNSTFFNSYFGDSQDDVLVNIASPDNFFVKTFPLSNLSATKLDVGLDTSFGIISPTPAIKWTNKTLHKTPGYFKGNLNVSNQTLLSVAITAKADIQIPDLTANYVNPNLWIPNPLAGNITLTNYTYQENLSSTFVTDKPIIAHLNNIDMPLVTTGLSGYHGIYSIAALPAPTFHAFALDSELQYLYRISSNGKILSAININDLVKNYVNYLIPETVSPATLALDSNQNIWISLYDTKEVIKLDKNGNFLKSVKPTDFAGITSLPTPSNLPIYLEDSSRYDQESFFSINAALSAFDDVNLLEPTYIDTDTEDNVWVTYTNSFSGLLLKYSSSGSVIQARTFPDPSITTPTIPHEIVCDGLGGFWISLKQQNGNHFYIQHRNKEGVPFADDLGQNYFWGPYENLESMNIDRFQNLWFTFSKNLVGYISASTRQTGYIVIPTDIDGEAYFTFLGGICADLKNKIYVINSIENKIIVIDGITKSIEKQFHINPKGLMPKLDSSGNLIFDYNKFAQSAAAQGDWSGLRWTNKYVKKITGNSYSFSISGVSPKLDFYTDNSTAFDAFKINENYDMATSIKDLFFNPLLQEKITTFYNDFLKPTLGSSPFKHDDLGVEMYENISNFVQNHQDIDTCSIENIYNLAEAVDINSDDFLLNYPPSIKKLMDLGSINLSRLYGSKKLDPFIVSEGEKNSPNVGPILSSTYTVSAEVPVVLNARLLGKFKLIYPGVINSQVRYDLDTLAEFLHLNIDNRPWNMDFTFHEYIPSTNNTYVEGVIDWNNPQTTIHKLKSKTYLNTVADVTNFSPPLIAVTDANGSNYTDINFHNNHLTISTTNDPFPAKAGFDESFNNEINALRKFKYAIEPQDFNFTFAYRGGTETTNQHKLTPSSPLGVMCNGVVIFSPSSNLAPLVGLSNAPIDFEYDYNLYPSLNDAAGGNTTVDGIYFYRNNNFLTTSWNNYRFWSSNAYYSNSSYNSDHFRHPDGHSKIIGYCFDGYPIYGPYGYSNNSDPQSNVIKMNSSYRLQSGTSGYFARRQKTFAELSAGHYIQDYIYDRNATEGTLDRYNGRYCVTPEYPEGTYAYFLTYKDSETSIPAYPYIFGPYTKERRLLTKDYENKLPLTLKEWMGDGGILDTMISYELYKGLDLLK